MAPTPPHSIPPPSSKVQIPEPTPSDTQPGLSYYFVQMILFLKRDVSTCREAPPSGRSYPLGQTPPLKGSFPSKTLLFLIEPPPFRGTFPQHHTANVSVYQNLPARHRSSVCSFRAVRPPPLRATAAVIVTPPLNVTPPLSVAPPLSAGSALQHRGIRSAPSGRRRSCSCGLNRCRVLNAHALFRDPVYSPYPTLPVLFWRNSQSSPGMGGVA